MSKLGEPWPEVQDAFLRAWEFRPTRAETLYEIAFRYRADERYHLGHLFAKRAAEIPIPAEDSSFVRTQIYNWRAADEQAVCASWIDKHEESFAICRRLLARDDLPDADRKRIAENRDIVAPTMLDAVAAYPGKLARDVVAGPRDCELTISTRSWAAASNCRGWYASSSSMPVCQNRIERPCCSVTSSSSSAVLRTRRGLTSGLPTSGMRSKDASGCTWARAGVSLPRSDS
jgi:hypothetical protein